MDFPTYPTDPNETRNAQLAIFGNWILMLLGRVAFWMLLEGLSLGVSLGRAHSQITYANGFIYQGGGFSGRISLRVVA